jgi:hypothetical protein
MAYRRPSRLASRMYRGPRQVCLMRPCAQRPNHCVLAAISSLPGAYNRPTPSLRVASGRSVRRLGLKADHAKTVAGKFSPSGKTRAAEGIRTPDPELGKLVLYQLSYHRLSPVFGVVDFYTTRPLLRRGTAFSRLARPSCRAGPDSDSMRNSLICLTPRERFLRRHAAAHSSRTCRTSAASRRRVARSIPWLRTSAARGGA